MVVENYLSNLLTLIKLKAYLKDSINKDSENECLKKAKTKVKHQTKIVL